MRINKIIIPTDYKDPYWTDNYKDLRQAVVFELGWPVVKLEITDVHINLAIHQAISKYLEYDDLGLNVTKLPVDAGGWATIPSEINYYFIRDVIFPKRKTGGASLATELSTLFLGSDEAFAMGAPNHSLMDFDVKGYMMMRRQYEDVKQVLGVERFWEILDGKIKIYPTAAAAETGEIGVIHGNYLSPEEYESDEWIRSFAVAKSKIILGTIRRKFSGFSYAGGQGTTDGAELINEGKEEIEKLLESKKLDLRPPSIFQY